MVPILRKQGIKSLICVTKHHRVLFDSLSDYAIICRPNFVANTYEFERLPVQYIVLNISLIKIYSMKILFCFH